MKSLLTILAGLLLCGSALCEKGEVVKRISGCDYYMVDAPSGYAILEWYGGYDPDTGDDIVGKFTAYGMHTFFVGSSEAETTAYVEDWGLNRESALEELVDKCE